MDMNVTYQKMLDNIYDGIYFVDTERKITFWNKGAETITGFLAEEMIGSHCYDNKLNHVDDFGNKLCFNGCPLHATIQDGQDRSSYLYLHHKEGHRVPVQVRTIPMVEDGHILGAVEVFTHQSEEFYSRYELDDYREITLRDQLTKLSNRKSIEERLDAEIKVWRKKPNSLALAFIDIDYFKTVNETYGYDMGDKVIHTIAKTLSSGIMKTDYIGRWDGEEYICLFVDTDVDTVKIISERLRMLVENSVLRTEQGEIKVTVSIGVTFYRSDEDTKVLVKRAALLIKDSKDNGRNKVTIG